jgi:hypothetical protein
VLRQGFDEFVAHHAIAYYQYAFFVHGVLPPDLRDGCHRLLPWPYVLAATCQHSMQGYKQTLCLFCESEKYRYFYRLFLCVRVYGARVFWRVCGVVVRVGLCVHEFGVPDMTLNGAYWRALP